VERKRAVSHAKSDTGAELLETKGGMQKKGSGLGGEDDVVNLESMRRPASRGEGIGRIKLEFLQREPLP